MAGNRSDKGGNSGGKGNDRVKDLPRKNDEAAKGQQVKGGASPQLKPLSDR